MAKRQSRGRSNSSSKRSASKSKSNSSGNGRRSSSRKRSKEEFKDYSLVDPAKIPDGPDLLVDVPVVKVDEIDLEVKDLRAQVAVMAEVRKLVKLSVGADVSLGKVGLQIQGVEAQALLKARLDHVTAILERVLLSLDRNPEILEGVGRAVEEVGGGTGKLLAESGEAVEDVGEGAEKALPQVGKGAGRAAGQVGQGAEQGLQGVGQGAQQGLQGVGQGAGRGVAGVGKGAQQATQNLGGGGKGGGS
jgi:hypothetical protein